MMESPAERTEPPTHGSHPTSAAGGMSGGSRGAFRVMAGQAARLAVSVVSVLYIAAAIGPESRGHLTVLMAVSSIAGVVCLLGLNGATTYLVGAGRWTVREAAALTLAWSVLSAGAATGAFLVVDLSSIGKSATASLPPLLLGLSTLGMVLLTMQRATQIGSKAYGALAASTVAPAVLNIVGFLVLRALGVRSGDAALVAWPAANLLAALPFTALSVIRGEGRFRLPAEKRYALAYGIRTAGANFMSLVNLRADVLLLAWLAGAAATGAYGVAVQLSEVSWLLPTAVGTVVFPEIAARDRKANGAWTAHVCRMTVVVVLFSSVAVAIGGTALFEWVMPAYRSATLALWLLVPGIVAYAIARIIGGDLFGRARPSAHLRAAALSVTVTIAGDLLLIPLLGVAGAAVVSSVAYAAYALSLVRSFTDATGDSAGHAWLPRMADVRDAWARAKSAARIGA